jgi:hypothetical protein
MSSRKKQSDMDSMQIGSSDDRDMLNPRSRAPKIVRYPPPKTTIVAFIFFTLGLFFLAFGISVLFAHIWKHGQDRGIAMIVLGALSKCLNKVFTFRLSFHHDIH